MRIIKLEGFKNIFAVDSFEEELSGLFGKNKFGYKKLRSALLRNLQMLDVLGVDALYAQGFERLVNEKLCAIKIKDAWNTRVIYSYVLGDGQAILLTGFFEKSASDYEPAKAKARAILAKLEELT